MADLEQLEEWVGKLLADVGPEGRLRIAREIGRDLKRAQGRRIAEQRNPDGSAYEPRKPREALRDRKGRIRRKLKDRPMFPKLRKAAYLKMEASASEVAVGYAAGAVSRIARVNQLGLRDLVSRRKNAPTAQYPVRELLGISEADRGMILDRVLKALERR